MSESDLNLAKQNKSLWQHIDKKRVMVIGFYLLATIIVWYLRHKNELSHTAIMLMFTHYPILAPFIFVFIYAFAMVFLIPTLPLNLSAGILFGAWWGGFLATIGGTIGAVIAFQIARSSLGVFFKKYFDNKLLAWLQYQLKAHPWKVVAFVRLNPLVPTAPINFIFGLTPISFADYMWPTLIFLYPSSVAVAIAGNFISKNVLMTYPTKLIDISFILFTLLTLFYFLLPILKKTFKQLKDPN